jgi:undecaprenyl-diphosphatase
LVSVVLVYRERITGLVTGAIARDANAWRYIGLLALATLPAAIVGLGMGSQVEALFERPEVTGVALLITGGLLWTTRAALARRPDAAPGTSQALLIGIAQAFALVPGISRSGATVVMALWLGIEAREAAAFSFLMAIPAIAGAAVLQAPELTAESPGVATDVLWGAAIAAGVTGVFAIRSFVALLRRESFHRFALYCWMVGGAFLVYLGMR